MEIRPKNHIEDKYFDEESKEDLIQDFTKLLEALEESREKTL